MPIVAVPFTQAAGHAHHQQSSTSDNQTKTLFLSTSAQRSLIMYCHVSSLLIKILGGVILGRGRAMHTL